MIFSVSGDRFEVTGDRDFSRDGSAEDFRFFAGQAADGPSSSAGHVEVRVVDRAAPGLLLLGRRTLAGEGRVERASRRAAMSGMVPNMIVGLGLFQGIENLPDAAAMSSSARLDSHGAASATHPRW